MSAEWEATTGVVLLPDTILVAAPHIVPTYSIKPPVTTAQSAEAAMKAGTSKS